MSIKFLSVFALFLQLTTSAQDHSLPANPFTSTTTITAIPQIVDLKAVVTNQKIQLNWKTEENQSINLFEVERSTDGKTFTLAALVFGTDKATAEEYLFFEKNTGKKTLYRVKIISKDKQVYYSSPVEAG
ncbi:MAG TPA: hypothetical protein PLL23_14915 [Chitinophagaceae bacterium]|nr:hypothetical protein [Chitinophagaceae bacterium]